MGKLKAWKSFSITMVLMLVLQVGILNIPPGSVLADNPTAQKLIGADPMTNSDAETAGNYFHLDRFTAEQSGNINELRVMCPSSGYIKVAVYADNNGEPGSLLNAVNIGTAVSPGWNSIPVSSTTVSAGTNYWMAWCADNNGVMGSKSTTNSFRRFKPTNYSSLIFPGQAGTGFTVNTEYSDIIAGWGQSLTPTPIPTPTPVPSGPLPIASLNANPSSMPLNGIAILNWSVVNATSVVIDHGIGPVSVSGSRAVSPNVTTDYTLVASNAVGSVTSVVRLVVDPLGSPNPIGSGDWLASTYTKEYHYPSCSIAQNIPMPSRRWFDSIQQADLNGFHPCPVCQPPTFSVPPVATPLFINSFTASPSSIFTGAASTLTWSVSNATAVSIDNGVGIVSSAGSRVISPAITTTYTLIASNGSNNISRLAQVYVTPTQPPTTDSPPVITSFTADPTALQFASTTTLTCIASDQDGDALQYKWEARDGTLSGEGNKVSWTSPNKGGNYSIFVVASDGKGAETRREIVIPVAAPSGVQTFKMVPKESGTVTSVGDRDNSIFKAGDDGKNIGYRAFFSYNIYPLLGTDIKQAKLKFIDGRVVGDDPFDPITGLGGFQVMCISYGNILPKFGTVDGSPFQRSEVYLNRLVTEVDVTPELITAVDNRLERFQVEAGFMKRTTNGNNVAQYLQWQDVVLEVLVGGNSPIPPPTPVTRPTINSFTASPSSISAGAASTLSWSVSNATSVTIDNGVGSVSSSGWRTMIPATTTTYSLLASNGANTADRTVTVNVTSTIPPTPPPPPTTGTSLVATSMTATPSGVIQVPIRLNDASNIGSMNFVLTYNPQVLKVNKIDTGSLLSGALFMTNYKAPPVVRFGLTSSDGISGSGTMAYIEFQVIGAAGSSSALTFSALSAKNTSGQAVAVTSQNGTVTVATGGKVKGDYNGDGKVTIVDVMAALKMSIQLLPEDLILDMDGDGAITAEDAQLILKIALGK